MTPDTPSTVQQRCWAVLAVVATLGALASIGLATAGLYPDTQDHTSAFGGHPEGWAGALPRLADALSYFTHWSVLVVAAAAWRVARAGRPAGWERVLLLCALMMITVTGIVYAVMLAPTAEVRGLEHVTNPWVHVVVPIATVSLWLVAGPRGWLVWRTVPLSLVLPLAWVAFMLARGALIDQYPYPFVDVEQFGYAQVLANVGGIVGFGVAVAALYRVADALLGRGRGSDRH